MSKAGAMFRGSGAGRPARSLLHSIFLTPLPGFVFLGFLLLLWEVSAQLGWISGRAWPAFSVVLGATAQGLMNGELAGVFGPSLARMFTGFAIGCGLGLLMGLLCGLFTLVRWISGPWLEVLRVLPAPAIIPSLILFLGVDDALKVTVIALTAFFPVYTNVMNGVKSADAVLLQTAQTFRLRRTKIYTDIYVPSLAPHVSAGMRVSIGISFVMTVVAEMISGGSGIGYFIMQTQYALRPEAMYTAVILLSVIGYLLNLVFIWLEKILIPWYGK